MPDPAARVAAKFACVLRFTSKEVDPSSGEPEEDGYEDEYTLEDVDFATLDLIKPSGTANFRKQWDETPEENERSDDYGLGTRESLEEAVDAVTQILGMAPCEGSEAVPPNARSHATLLSGTFVGDVRVLVRLNLGIDANQNVAMKLTVRSSDPAVSDLIHQIIANA
jgi:coatomer protein complex subunit gamma